MKIVNYLSDSFKENSNTHWFCLSRLTNLMIILNLSMFFVTELVTKQGYYYTYYSLFCLVVVQLGLIVPLGLLGRLWYYCIFLVFEFVAANFFIRSVAWWVATNKV
jgi:hypothetical protein